MTNSDELSQLRDIHLPPPIAAWPLAYGWYILMALVFIVVLVFSYKTYQWIIYNRPKRLALKMLKDYLQEYQRDKNSQFSSARVSELLKRVALAYYPRQQVAGLQGNDWIEFLNRTSKGLDFKSVKNLLVDLPFQPNPSASLKPLFNRSEAWIKQQGGRCSS